MCKFVTSNSICDGWTMHFFNCLMKELNDNNMNKENLLIISCIRHHDVNYAR